MATFDCTILHEPRNFSGLSVSLFLYTSVLLIRNYTCLFFFFETSPLLSSLNNIALNCNVQTSDGQNIILYSIHLGHMEHIVYY